MHTRICINFTQFRPDCRWTNFRCSYHDNCNGDNRTKTTIRTEMQTKPKGKEEQTKKKWATLHNTDDDNDDDKQIGLCLCAVNTSVCAHCTLNTVNMNQPIYTNTLGLGPH